MTKRVTHPVTHDIARLNRLLAMIETSILPPFELFGQLRQHEEADIRDWPDGTFSIRLAGVKVQTTAGQINALLMWQGKARAIIEAAEASA